MNYITTQRMRKRAGLVQDMVGAGVTSGILGAISPAAGHIVNTAGTMHGMLSDAPSEDELNKMRDTPGKSWIPGVGTSRIMRKRTGLSKKYGQGKTNMISEQFGPLTTLLTGAGVGGALGAGIGAAASGVSEEGTLTGLGIGAGAGAGLALLASLVGMGAAAITPTRTDAEQEAYERSKPAVANFLIPGVGTYNDWKSRGRILADEKDYQKLKDLKRLKTIRKEQQEARKS